jgi:hypothetical protein
VHRDAEEGPEGSIESIEASIEGLNDPKEES